MVHGLYTTPLPDERGVDLMPNTLTRAAIQEVNITRQPSPYTSNCSGSWSTTNYSAYIDSDDNGWTYYSLPVSTFIHCYMFQ